MQSGLSCLGFVIMKYWCKILIHTLPVLVFIVVNDFVMRIVIIFMKLLLFLACFIDLINRLLCIVVLSCILKIFHCIVLYWLVFSAALHILTYETPKLSKRTKLWYKSSWWFWIGKEAYTALCNCGKYEIIQCHGLGNQSCKVSLYWYWYLHKY